MPDFVTISTGFSLAFNGTSAVNDATEFAAQRGIPWLKGAYSSITGAGRLSFSRQELQKAYELMEANKEVIKPQDMRRLCRDYDWLCKTCEEAEQALKKDSRAVIYLAASTETKMLLQTAAELTSEFYRLVKRVSGDAKLTALHEGCGFVPGDDSVNGPSFLRPEMIPQLLNGVTAVIVIPDDSEESGAPHDATTQQGERDVGTGSGCGQAEAIFNRAFNISDTSLRTREVLIGNPW